MSSNGIKRIPGQLYGCLFWWSIMKKKKKEKDILRFCMRYNVCSLCPRNIKCLKELGEESKRKDVFNHESKSNSKDSK